MLKDIHRTPAATGIPAIPLPSVEFLREVLLYDPLTGIFTWKVRRGKRVKAGDQAGSVSKWGYRTLVFNKQRFLAHRVAWKIHYGIEPAPLLDHRNRNRDDNRIENLRYATPKGNARNRNVRQRDMPTGVRKLSRRVGFIYKAEINSGGSYAYLGSFHTPEEASDAYTRAAKSAYGEFLRS